MQILILIFAEVLGLYGLIVALILNTNSGVDYQVSRNKQRAKGAVLILFR
jgi:hypothetical protein